MYETILNRESRQGSSFTDFRYLSVSPSPSQIPTLSLSRSSIAARSRSTHEISSYPPTTRATHAQHMRARATHRLLAHAIPFVRYVRYASSRPLRRARIPIRPAPPRRRLASATAAHNAATLPRDRHYSQSRSNCSALNSTAHLHWSITWSIAPPAARTIPDVTDVTGE